MTVLQKIMDGVPDEEVERMCFSNAVELYDDRRRQAAGLTAVRPDR